jgi:hypothetical protein
MSANASAVDWAFGFDKLITNAMLFIGVIKNTTVSVIVHV